jgi:hypothetical protein
MHLTTNQESGGSTPSGRTIYRKTIAMCKPKIKKMNGFVSFITFGWAAAITLAPFGIYVQQKYLDWEHTAPYSYNRIINHEKIHWQQQLEMLIIFFYLWYLIEWFIKLILPPYDSAYSALSFEREAEDNESNFDYLKTRKHYAWIKRLFK